MPARKSDAARRSDVSVARFVLADEDTVPKNNTKPEASSSMTTDAAAAAAAAPKASIEPTSTNTQTSPHSNNSRGDKDKDKEREREEKSREKEKERDVSEALTIEDLTLPKSIITRLAKGVLPPNTQIQANAILALSKGATVFINHLANSANEFTMGANKKTIMPADVFRALDDIEYGFMRERVEAEFAKFNEIQTSKRSDYRKRVAAMKKAGSRGEGWTLSMSAEDDSMAMSNDGMGDASFVSSRGEGGEAQQQPRMAKKPRIDSAAAAAAAEGGRMDVDQGEPSDAETVPDEEEEEEDEEGEEAEEGDEEEEDEEEEEREGDEEQAGADEDEALDDEEDSE
ncbi:histone-fold-containing protein [Echria macrotheca]|uniref:DNA polymerase epsilon subunit D n=1 Tax=Echria macrotheca TaxID=438768 RepID=A0AAJ0F710_9PEZI|nr:histone-fold-containing protein [Echria macrotheca]